MDALTQTPAPTDVDVTLGHSFPGTMPRSPDARRLDSAEMERLQAITHSVVRKVEWYEEEVVRMHNELARSLNLGVPVERFEELAEHIGLKHKLRAADQPTGLSGKCAVSGALMNGNGTQIELSQEREDISQFEPCQHLRLRLHLQPSDRDFVSHAMDKHLSTVFKNGVTEYIREVLLNYVGKIPLEELKEIGVSHASRCFRNVSAAKKHRRRILLEQAATEDERGSDGFIGGLEEVLDSHLGVSQDFPRQTTRKFLGKASPILQAAYSRGNRSSTLANNHSGSVDGTLDLPIDTERSDAYDTMAPTLRSNLRPTKNAHTADATTGSPSIATQSARYRRNTAALLRWRELGSGQIDSRGVHTEHVQRQLQSQTLDHLQPWRQWSKAAKDVLTTVWSPSGRHFGIGAASDLDSQNIQYNDRGTLLFGDIETNAIVELDDHKIDRFRAERGPNALQDTINTLDPYLYTTVTGIRFDENNDLMFTSSYDKTVKIWELSNTKPKCQQTLSHSNSVAVVDLSSDSRCLATIQDSMEDAVTLFRLEDGVAHRLINFGTDRSVKSKLTPTCLQFGKTRNTAHLLLAGFSENSDEYAVKNREGELSLWDIRSSSFAKYKLVSTSRAVHDAIWSPHSPFFTAAVAVDPGNSVANRAGIQSHIRTWSPLEALHKIYEFDCPALDINELRLHPFNPNYISASCTDGATYLWDARKPGYDQYVTRLKHADPIDAVDDTVIHALGYARAREEVDTGVKLVAWDSEGRHLYTGSSDGIVKQWNPWVAEEDALVRDVMTAPSGVTAGSFSRDHSHLLVGLANGAIRILSSAPLTTHYDVYSANNHDITYPVEAINFIPAKVIPEEEPYEQAANELLATGQVAIHPDLGAMKGPCYKGPYAAWARKGTKASDLASTELDPDVLADQIHPQQWQKGLEAGGQPTVAAQERQKWLQQRKEELSMLNPLKPKRASQSPGSPASQSTMPARKKHHQDLLSIDNDSNVSSDTGFKTPLPSPPSEDELALHSTSSLSNVRRSPMKTPSTPTRSGTASWASSTARNGVSAYDATQRPIPIHTPSPTATRIKSSPHSSFRSRGSLEYNPRSKPQFRMPRPAPDSPFRDREKARAQRAQNQQSAGGASAKGELIVLDDD